MTDFGLKVGLSKVEKAALIVTPSFEKDTAEKLRVSESAVASAVARGPNRETLAGTKYEPAKYRDALAIVYKKGDAERETLTQELIGKMAAGASHALFVFCAFGECD